MIKNKVIKFIAFIVIAISLILNLYLLSLLKIEKRTDVIFSENKNLELKQFLPITIEQTAENLINKKCTEDTSNVYMTECAIKLLDSTAAEREWKQRKIEAAKHPQINTYDMIPVLSDEQLKISSWRKNFEKMRDAWCNAKNTFIIGSGTPLAITECQLGFELLAINDLNNLYYSIIMKNIYDSQGIPNFEPTSTDIDTLTKVNATSRGCVWAGETNCK
jgi:hypothetical protein